MTILFKLTVGLVNVAFVAAMAIPVTAQQATNAHNVRIMQPGTMNAPGTFMGRRALQVPGDMPFMHALPESGQTIRPGIPSRSPFGSAVVTGVQQNTLMFRSQSGFVGGVRLPSRVIQGMRLRAGVPIKLIPLGGGLMRIQVPIVH